MAVFQSDLRSAIHIAAEFRYLSPLRPDSRSDPRPSLRPPPSSKSPQWRLAAVRPSNAAAAEENRTVADKPSICTAEELHYVPVRDSDWRLALWRYRPSPKAPQRNHPLLLLSGVGTNAIGYDLAPGSSFARYMSSQGFDTWVLEFRGAGLSAEVDSREVKLPIAPNSQKNDLATKIKANGAYSGEDMSDSLVESEVSSAKKRREVSTEPGSSEARQNSALAGQIKDLSRRLATIVEEGQRSVSPPFLDLLVHCATVIEDFQKQLDLIVKYNWDFDHYLDADVPAAMDYIRMQCKPKDGKLLAIGHSMGGILLYAMLSQNGCRGGDSKLASVVTLASSLDYTSSKSSLRFILPLTDPAQVFNVPVVPLGALLAAAHPLASRPPYVMSWLKTLISAENMMHPELLEKLVLTNFCTVPTKLLLQLSTAFHEGGLCDRSATIFYKDHLHKSDVPILALAGDQDLICPPEAVYETVRLIPAHLVTYRVFGEPGGPHYGHYDLVGGRLAAAQVYPSIIKFLTRHD